MKRDEQFIYSSKRGLFFIYRIIIKDGALEHAWKK